MNNHIVDEWVVKSKKDTRYVFFEKYPLDDRVMRLFSVACCQEVWNKITSEWSKKAIEEIAELCADGLNRDDESIKARDDSWDVYYSTAASNYVSSAAAAIAGHVVVYSDFIEKECEIQGLILASMYPISFNYNWVTSTTRSLARTIYYNKDFSLMPILADALQDIDCNEEILNHLRGTGPFYKGNYIIDVLTGKRL